MNYLDRNLTRFFDLTKILQNVKPIASEACIKTKDGNLSLRVDGRLLHSVYNPIDESMKLISSYEIDDAPIIVLGFGLGYHIRCLFEKHPGRRILVVERNLSVLKKALELFDFSELDGEIRFFLEEDPVVIMSDYEFYSAINRNPTIIVHRASTLSFIRFYQNLTDSILSVNRFGIGKRLKVSIVSPLMGGSLGVSKFVAAALEELGAEVDFIDNAPHYPAYREISDGETEKEERLKSKAAFFRFLTDTISVRINRFEPDLVLALAQAPMSVGLLNVLHSRGIKTAFWFVENFRHMTYWKYMASYYDYFFAIQKDKFFSLLEEGGIRNYYYLPMAASEKIHRSRPGESYAHELSFVGAGYANRQFFFESILSMDPALDLSIWGNDWNPDSKIFSRVQNNGQRLGTGELQDIYTKSKIIVNLHSSVDGSSGMPQSDRDYVNPRTFELAAMGVFQLVDHREGLCEFFEIGKELITFRNEKDFLEKVHYYLKNNLERNEIALNARTRVLRDHTYTKRLTEMLSRVFGIGVLKSLGPILTQSASEKGKAEMSPPVPNREGKPFDSDVALEALGRELLKEQSLSGKE